VPVLRNNAAPQKKRSPEEAHRRTKFFRVIYKAMDNGKAAADI
jgi:hypothetical protein